MEKKIIVTEATAELHAYKLLFHAIADDIIIKQITESELTISSNLLSAEYLEELLSDPKQFRNAIRQCILIPQTNTTVDLPPTMHPNYLASTLPYSLLARNTIEKLNDNFFTALFDNKILHHSALAGISKSLLDEIEGNITFVIEDYEFVKELWEARIKMLQKVLIGAGPAGIASVFTTGQPLSFSGVKPQISEISEHIDDIVGLKISGDKAIFYLNKSYLINLVLAPEIQAIAVPEQSKYRYTMVINKKHFTDYLGKIFGDIVMPAQSVTTDNEQDIPRFVTPVIIPRAVTNTIKKQNIYVFIIDMSGSLESVMAEYKQQLGQIIDTLIDNIKVDSHGYINSKDIIRIVLFDHTYIYQDFAVAKVLQDTTPIKNYLHTKNTLGHTHLYGTVAAQLTDIVKLYDSSACNVNVLICTDGMDNTDDNGIQKNILLQHGNKFRAQIEQGNMSAPIHKIHLFRVGTDANIPKLEEISQGLDAEIHDITNIQDIAKFFGNIKKMNLYRELVQFIQEEISTVIPIYQHQLTIGPELQTDINIKINGINYAIEQDKEYKLFDFSNIVADLAEIAKLPQQALLMFTQFLTDMSLNDNQPSSTQPAEQTEETKSTNKYKA